MNSSSEDSRGRLLLALLILAAILLAGPYFGLRILGGSPQPPEQRWPAAHSASTAGRAPVITRGTAPPRAPGSGTGRSGLSKIEDLLN